MSTTLAILALVMGSPFHGTALKGGEALQQLTDFEKQFQADAKTSGKRIQLAAYRAAIKQKADELLTGVDITAVPTDESLAWAHVLDAATRFQDSVTVLDHFIAANPNAEDAVTAKVAEVNDLRNLKQQDKALTILKDLKPASEKQVRLVVSADAAEAQSLASAPGGDGNALKFIDSVIPNFKGFSSGEKMLKSVKGGLMAPSTRKNLVGQDAVELTTLPGMYGSYSNLASLKGKVVILDFFAHWCPPCKASMPDMRKLTDDLGSKVAVIGVTGYYGYFGAKQGIDQKEEFSDMKGFMDEYKMDHPVVYIDRGDFAQYGANGIPEFVLIGKDGKIKHIEVGYSAGSFAEFRKLVEAEAN